jgi:hypothetical protein
MRHLIGIAAILLGISCASGPGEPIRTALLPADQAAAFEDLCSRSGIARFERGWDPEPADIRRMESSFRQLSRMKATKCCFLRGRIGKLNDFSLQYVGVVAGGRKYIYVNAACGASDDLWDTRAFASVCDGGTCHWGALYDIERGRFTELAINGSA